MVFVIIFVSSWSILFFFDMVDHSMFMENVVEKGMEKNLLFVDSKYNFRDIYREIH